MSRLLGLFQLMDEQPHFVHLWERLGSKEAIKDFLLNIFHLFNELVNKDIYPSEWASMRFMAINVLLKTLQVCKDTKVELDHQSNWVISFCSCVCVWLHFRTTDVSPLSRIWPNL